MNRGLFLDSKPHEEVRGCVSKYKFISSYSVEFENLGCSWTNTCIFVLDQDLRRFHR